MFGKRNEKDQGSGRPAASGDSGQAFLERQKADNDDGAALEAHGTATTAIVTAVTLAAEYQGPAYEPEDFTHPPQEWTVTADLGGGDGHTFSATFPVFLDEIGDPPALGEQINVAFDPSDHSRVRAKVVWRQQAGGAHSSILWKVPAVCPNCGAPVDQSTQSMAAHPLCAMCEQPLPCEPAA